VGALITAGSPTDNTAVAPTSVTGAASGLFEVAQVDRLRVFVNVPQVYAPNVRAGLPAQLTVRGQQEAPVAASVTRTSSALDPGTRTLLAQVDIANTSGRLLPGMFVYITFKVPPTGTRWRVPATAVIIDAQGTRVATIAGPRLRDIDRHPGRAARRRNDRHAADGVVAGGAGRAADRARAFR
jgi:hypothetical protein